ncbi:hypothetical protein [Robertmurraya kyonggiensis]|nr:hypothetical protein [Robertmurraya kyonggiensis]
MLITDKVEIEEFIKLINTSPRDFFLLTLGFKYDHSPHGMLIFENDEGKLEMGFVLDEDEKMIVIADHWDLFTKKEITW